MGGLFSYSFVKAAVTFILAFLNLALFLLRRRLRQDKLAFIGFNWLLLALIGFVVLIDQVSIWS
jgi:hypothetical protein